MNDTTERAIATAVQALLAIGTAGATPIVLPGVPPWVGLVAGIIVAVAAAVAKSLGISAAASAALSTTRKAVDSVVDQVTPVLTNSNIPAPPAPVITLAEPGHTEAAAAAPARAAAPQFDQTT